ncbi:hypothetical protein SAMN04488505_105383 [Chitinophaga rupis]|uniref:YhhN-like protein n=1 Tax=Chitinophaga rupis TaxID=573321 RepID=A0A1H8ADW9_9BACT|nr:hypothetical protein SAMN04488505_105383 [Chitinophaga rupis]
MTGIECLLLIPFTLNYSVLDKAGRWAYYYLLSSVVFALGSLLIAALYRNNLWFTSVMHLLQFIILSAYYYVLIKRPPLKLIIKILLIPAFILFILDFFKLEGIYTYNSIFATVRTCLLLAYGIIFFIQLLSDDDLIKEAVFINSLPNFWFNSGLFIYLCSSFLFSLAYNFFLRHSLYNTAFQPITFIGGIIEGILFYIGLMKAKKLRS